MYQFTRKLFPGCRIAYSDKGYMTAELSEVLICEHIAGNVDLSDGEPRLLVMDGHTTHLTYTFLKFCLDNEIYPIIIPSHTSHLLQPLDVGVFGPYAKKYSQALDNYVLTHLTEDYIGKEDFFPILAMCRDQALTPQNIIKSFEATGIHPFNNRIIVTRNGILPSHKMGQTEDELAGSGMGRLGTIRFQTPPSTPPRSKESELFDLIKTPAHEREIRDIKHLVKEATERGDDKAVLRGVEALGNFAQRKAAEHEIEKFDHNRVLSKRKKVTNKKNLHDTV